jgi:hypothetical protein
MREDEEGWRMRRLFVPLRLVMKIWLVVAIVMEVI